jgi:HEAT repeat protein
VITVCLLSGCSKFDGLSETDMPSMSTEQLIQIIEDPKSDLFISATEELARRGADAAEAAPALAKALGYPRHDSDSAGFALVSMGAAAEPAVPYLIPILRNDRADVRADASLVLGVIRAGSRCAIPEIAPMLWDKDPTARGAAAVTLDALTNQNLVPQWHKLDLSTPFSIAQDFPEGILTKDARTWWEQEGQFFELIEDSDNCTPLNK